MNFVNRYCLIEEIQTYSDPDIMADAGSPRLLSKPVLYNRRSFENLFFIVLLVTFSLYFVNGRSDATKRQTVSSSSFRRIESLTLPCDHSNRIDWRKYPGSPVHRQYKMGIRLYVGC